MASIILTWTDLSATESGFLIERSLNQVNWTEIITLPADSIMYTDLGLSNNVIYYYRISSFSDTCVSEYVYTQEYIPLSPNQLSGFIATAVSENQIDLVWIDNADNEDGYLLEYSINNIDWFVEADLPPDTESYNHINLLLGTTYYYRINVYNIACSSISIIDSATTFGFSINSNYVPLSLTSYNSTKLLVSDFDQFTLTVYDSVVFQAYIVTAKSIDGPSPDNESYDKTELWTGADSNQITLAGFFRVPAFNWQQQAVFLSNGSPFFFSFFKWWDGGDNAFNIFTNDGNGDEYTVVTAGVTDHGVNVGDWFAFMFSVDTSPAGDPVRSIWIHKKGDVTGTNLLIGTGVSEFTDVGPLLPYVCGDTGTIASIGQHPWYLADVFEETHYYMTDEYVNWNDQAVRDLFVDNLGRPVNIGADGSGLTGTPAKIFLIDGDGTNNGGTAGNFTQVGTISNSSTSPSD